MANKKIVDIDIHSIGLNLDNRYLNDGQMPTPNFTKIAFGGGCHWCTEAVFQSLLGGETVEQGFVASTGSNSSFSDAVVVHFDPSIISLKVLIEIHLHTHGSTSLHSMRDKYRSAIYSYSWVQAVESKKILHALQPTFGNKIITKVYSFKDFKPSPEQFVAYFYKNPNKPFCERFIHPKLKTLLRKFPGQLEQGKIAKAMNCTRREGKGNAEL